MDILKRADIPVIGRRVDDESIKALRETLALLESGECINVAIIAQRKNGDVIIRSAPGFGDKVKMIGSAHVLARRLEDDLIKG